MSLRTYILLFLSGLILPLVIAQFQPIPGYLDSDYYYAGGIQLATGKGFTEPYLWNYLDDPQSLPHPSHNYWMPLASILAALGMWVTGQATYAVARIPFILIAACIPPLTAALAWQFSQRRDLAITSAILAIFSVYHAPFVGVTDNFSLFMLFGGLYFLVTTSLITNPNLSRNWLIPGILAGFMTLSRTDGLLWLGLTFLFAIWKARETTSTLTQFTNYSLRITLFIFLGFLLVTSPWYARNFNLYGSIMAPGGSRALWLDNYDQTFSFPASQLTLQSFLSLGWKEILSDRLWALGNNLQSGFAAHGAIILFPFILVGIMKYRRDERVRLGAIAWLILFVVMTLVFPFAGARGAFFHAGASLQPLWWTLAPLGLESVVASARKRGLFSDQAQVIFRSALVLVVVILTGFVVWLRLFSLGWGEGELGYPKIERILVEEGAASSDVVIVRNPVGYYIASSRSAIVIPYGDEQTMLALARQFGARYLILESKAVLPQLKDLYENPQGREHFNYLDEFDGTRIYEIIQ
ncbi:MAG: hypothetical protein HZB19_19735 [Chloroflexi bacterium]|nr:hypothetical protein [Chloroflexota bacterium]